MKVIEPENGGYEIKEFEKTERNFVLIIDYPSIKKMNLDFMQPIYNAVFQGHISSGKWTAIVSHGKCQQNSL